MCLNLLENMEEVIKSKLLSIGISISPYYYQIQMNKYCRSTIAGTVLYINNKKINFMTKKSLVHYMNFFAWQFLTDKTAIDQKLDVNINSLITENSVENVFRYVKDAKDSGTKFSFSEMLMIEKLSALYLDILIATNSISIEVAEYGDDAFIEPYESIIEDACVALHGIKKAHPDGIPIYYLEGDEIHEKSCPYFFFSQILMSKVDGN